MPNLFLMDFTVSFRALILPRRHSERHYHHDGLGL